MIVNPPLLGQAVEKTREQLELFKSGGVRPGEVEAKKRTVAGRYRVELASTGGLAQQMLQVAEWDLGIPYMDMFPILIGNLTPDQVNEAIRRYYHPESLSVVIAGNPE